MSNERTITNLDSRADWEAAVECLIVGLPDAEVRTLTLVAAAPADWPLGASSAQIDALTRWARRPGRRFQLIGLHFDELALRNPRLSLWRRNWNHVIEAWRPVGIAESDIPNLLIADEQVIDWRSNDPPKGFVKHDASASRRATLQVDALLQRSESAWPMVTLGL
jgi:hypothetical protein